MNGKIMNRNHIYFFGILVFCSAILTGTSMILSSPYSGIFGGVLIISYTMLQMLIGVQKDEREDI